MLVDVQYIKNRLILSYVDDSGAIKLKEYKIENPQEYVVCDDEDPERHPKYKSWEGESVKLVPSNRMDRYAIYEFLDNLPEDEREEIFKYNLPKMYFIDIETEIVDGFPDAESAPTKVLSISIVYDDKIILMGLKDMPKDMQDRILNNTNEYFKSTGDEYKFKYLKYDCEFDMLYEFFYNIVPKMSLMTGWNFLDYDWKYLVNRARKMQKHINGKVIKIDPAISSPTKKLEQIWSTDYEVPLHRLIFDYMQLYEICDTSIKVKESSSLDFVSKKLVGVDKIKYNGSLQKLYEEDFETFMYYNAVDSVLVQKIHNARNYISIIFGIATTARIKVTDVVSQMNKALGSLAITEGVLRNRFREEDNIVLFKNRDKVATEAKGITGGWVKEPVVGMNRWVVTYDFASLYPRTQLEFFICPENFVGVRYDDNSDFCVNNRGQEIKIDKDVHVVCNNGVVFRKRMSPTLNMINDVYFSRKTNKNQMIKCKEELDKINLTIKLLKEDLGV